VAKSLAFISIHFVCRILLAFVPSRSAPPRYALFIIIIFKCNDNKRSLITIFTHQMQQQPQRRKKTARTSGSEGHRGASKKNGANGANISHSHPPS